MILALVALFVALDGPATAAHWINGRTIKPHSISTARLTKGTVKELQRTPSKSVGTKQLRAKAVDGSRIANGAVGSAALTDRGVGAVDLADGAVGSNQLASGAVSASKIADGAVGGAAVSDGSLQTQDIGDFAGKVQIDFPSLGLNICQSAVINPTPTASSRMPTIADDVVSVSPTTSGWPDQVFISANPGAGNTLRIVACQVGMVEATRPTTGPQPIDPPDTTFQYVAFDAP